MPRQGRKRQRDFTSPYAPVMKRGRRYDSSWKSRGGIPISMLLNSTVAARTIPIETKFFDVEENATQFGTAWAAMEPATTNLTAVAQGDTESTRDGRTYEICSIHISGHVFTADALDAATPLDDIICRLVLVWDTQTNGAQLTATQVMDAGGTADTFAFRNLQFSKRFIVLCDKKIRLPVGQTMTQNGTAKYSAAAVSIPFKMNKTFKTPLKVTTSGTTADIANITDNSIHMIGCATDTLAKVTYQSRLRFRG